MNPVHSSFRDPDNQVYTLNNNIYRQIHESGLQNYQKLMQSGLYEKLCALHYLVPHTEASLDFALNKTQAKVVLEPERVCFISYPYEWCFSQLKDAALLTLEITQLALQHDMILKDASAYNIQFDSGKPILIDTCSFEAYQEGSPWIAYQQFCKHFLAPLTLMAKKDIRLGIMAKNYIDGIPLDLASQLLPLKTHFSLSLLAHIHAHAKAQQKLSASKQKLASRKISKIGLLGLLDHLTSVINSLKLPSLKTEWGNYYSDTNYSAEASQDKSEIIQQMVHHVSPNLICDLGANNGHYSRIASKGTAQVLSFDIDPMAVEYNYLQVKRESCRYILPLLQDLTNPSSTIGWAQSERPGLQERVNADLVMALALIHHLAISNNVPLKRIAAFFSSLGEYLLIEFVSKEDSQVQHLLTTRKDIFPHYHLEGFKSAFNHFFDILEEKPIKQTYRTLFLMKRKSTLCLNTT